MHAICCTLASIVLFGTDIFGATLVSPPENASTPGSSGQFGFNGDGGRVLAVYPATDFLSAMPEGAIITQIAFRLDESIHRALATVIPDVEVRMSTTPSLLPDFGGQFASFVGSDETTARSRGPLSVKAAASTQSPNPFAFAVPLDRPFHYDPRNGNLAIDMFTYRAAAPGNGFALDADGTHAKMFAGGGDLAVFTLPAFVLQLTYTAIPEPHPTFLLALGGICLIVARISFAR